MGRVSKFTAEQIATMVELAVTVGPQQAAREMAKIGVSVSAGGIYFYVKKAGKVCPPRKPIVPIHG